MPLHHITREASSMGVVVALSGVVAVVGVEGFKRILKLGDILNEDEHVVTGGEGEVTIGFADGSNVEVGRDSELALNSELFDTSGFDGNIANTLLAMRGAINAGQPAVDVLNGAANGTLGMVDIDYTPGTTQPVNPPYDYINPGTGDSDEPVGDTPTTPPVTEPPDDPPVEPPQNSLPEISISDAIIQEPAMDTDNVQGSGSGTLAVAEFTVSLSEASTEDVTLHFRTVDGTAITTGENLETSDYEHNAGVLTIPAGETTATISVTIYGDDLIEGNESFIVHLHHADNASLADNQGIGVIVDNEPSGQGGGSGGLGFGGTDLTPGDNEPTDGDDIIHGSGGHDTLEAQDGDDIVFGAGGDDTLRGGHDDDILIGGAGDDVLVGNLGNDTLLGQVGDDILSGNAGDDLLIGGRGEDLLTGGGGSDIFSYTDLSEAGDVITDFKENQDDAIDISELLDGYNEGDDLSDYINIVQDGSDLELYVDPSGTGDYTLLVTLQDSASQLSSDPLDLLAEGSLIINNNTIV